MIDRETIAAEIYSTYCRAIGGVAFNGDPLPSWYDLAADPAKVKQSNAWLATADRVIELMIG